MLRIVLRSLVRAGLVIGAVSSVATGCSRQGEGERCDYTWAGDQDCDSGLVCTQCGWLQDQSVSRCCRPDGTYSDTRCIPTTNKTSEVCDTHTGTGATSSGGTSGTTEETAGIGGAPSDGG